MNNLVEWTNGFEGWNTDFKMANRKISILRTITKAIDNLLKSGHKQING